MDNLSSFLNSFPLTNYAEIEPVTSSEKSEEEEWSSSEAKQEVEYNVLFAENLEAKTEQISQIVQQHVLQKDIKQANEEFQQEEYRDFKRIFVLKEPTTSSISVEQFLSEAKFPGEQSRAFESDEMNRLVSHSQTEEEVDVNSDDDSTNDTVEEIEMPLDKESISNEDENESFMIEALQDPETVRLYEDEDADKEFHVKKDRYLQAIHLNPTNSEAYYELGWMSTYTDYIKYMGKDAFKLLNGKTITILNLYRKAIDLNPNYGNAYYGLAEEMRMQDSTTITLFNGAEMTDKALYRKAIELGSDHVAAYINLACAFEKEETVTLPDGRRMADGDLFLEAIKLELVGRGYWDKRGSGFDIIIEDCYNLCSHYPEKMWRSNGTRVTMRDIYLESIKFKCEEEEVDNAIKMRAYSYLADMLQEEETVTLPDGRVMTKQDLLLELLKLPGYCEFKFSIYKKLVDHLPEKETVMLPDSRTMTKRDLYLEIINLYPNESIFNILSIYKSLADSLLKEETITLPTDRVMTKREVYMERIKLALSAIQKLKDQINQLINQSNHYALGEEKARMLLLYHEKFYVSPKGIFNLYQDLGDTLQEEETVRLDDGSVVTKTDLYLKGLQYMLQLTNDLELDLDNLKILELNNYFSQLHLKFNNELKEVCLQVAPLMKDQQILILKNGGELSKHEIGLAAQGAAFDILCKPSRMVIKTA